MNRGEPESVSVSLYSGHIRDKEEGAVEYPSIMSEDWGTVDLVVVGDTLKFTIDLADAPLARRTRISANVIGVVILLLLLVMSAWSWLRDRFSR